MSEIIAEPTALSKVIPLKFKINDVDVPKTTQLSTNKQFNTSDTDAWFTFELDGLASTNGTYDLTLINLDDKSIFHHDNVLFAALPFHYKLNSSDDITLNEIRHAGRWLGQLVVTMGNGDTTSRQFGFNISGHILDGQDAQVILLSDYQALINTINLAKDDLTQYNVDYAALIADVDAAEAIRAQAEINRAATFDALVDSEMIAQNVETKLTEKEATFAPRMLSVEQQLEQTNILSAEAVSKADAMASGSPKGVYATLAALQASYPTGTTGAYLVTADGNWYYWSGSAWAVGGLYQAGTLKNYKRQLTASDNIDTLFSEGAYLLTTATTPGTYPSGVSTYAIFEVEGTSNFYTQKITNAVANGIATRVWVRSWQNSLGAWVELTNVAFKTYKRSLTSADNIDELKSEGQYWLAKATTTLGTYPTDLGQYAIVDVQAADTNYVVQQITNLTNSSLNAPRRWVRSRRDSWSDWVETSVAQTLKDDVTKLKQDVNGFPIVLRELPNGVKDTFVDNQDGTYTLTQNIKESTLVDADIYGIYTGYTNVEYVRIYKPLDYIGYNVGANISGNLKLEGTLGDKPIADNIANIGYVSSVSVAFFAPVVAKGTYADIAAAKAALVGKRITYQLTTPIVHTITATDSTNTLQIAKLTSAMDGVLNTYATRPWQGKVANFLGDSITEGATVDGSYVPVVKDLLGLSVSNNYGVAGGRLCNTTAEIDALYTPLIDRYTQIDMSADIIFILIGTNDYTSQVPIGATDSSSTYEFKGALNIMMDWFRINFPDKLVIFSTLLHRYNDTALTIKAQEYRDAIKERCFAKKFVCYDAFANTGFDFIAGYYDHILTADGLHPNTAGNTILGRKIAGFINAQ